MPNTEVSNPVHVVAGIIRNPRHPAKIFFTRRSKGQHLEDLWEFPGGKLEQGESRFQALQRELMEETGIRVISAQPFHSVIHQYKEKTIYLDVWEVIHFSGRAHAREGQEFLWLNLDEASKYLFPEADLPVLKALSLPAELLITPDIRMQDMDSYLNKFTRLMQNHRYPLVQFRSHHLNDNNYERAAVELNKICETNKAELIIHRPGLHSLKLKRYDGFRRRHINSTILRYLKSNPFDESIVCSASCHDSEELDMAERLNCEFALLSSVRDTASHPNAVAKGWYQFKQMTLQARIPVYALGGIQRKDLSAARYQAAIGVAGISDFWNV